METKQQHQVQALHSDSGLNRHMSLTFCTARPALGKQASSTAHSCLKSKQLEYKMDANITCAHLSVQN